MRDRDKLLLGALAGAGVVWGVRAWLRARRRIELTDRVIIITGASTGMGFLAAKEAAGQGAHLVLAARGHDELEAAGRDLRGMGAASVLVVPTDVTDQAQVNALVDRTVERHGRIDILVNNAGIIGVGPIETMTLDDFRSMMATHFWGPLYATMAVLPHMRARQFGRIANVVSVGGKAAVPHLLPYTASKFALSGLTEGLRIELARDNILVTGIYPHTMRTGGHTHAEFKGKREAEYTWFALSDSLPLVSTSAEHVARTLWRAVCNGDAEVVVGWPARVAVVLQNLFPNELAEVMMLVNGLLPGADRADTTSVRGEDLTGAIPGLLSRLVPPSTRPFSA